MTKFHPYTGAGVALLGTGIALMASTSAPAGTAMMIAGAVLLVTAIKKQSSGDAANGDDT